MPETEPINATDAEALAGIIRTGSHSFYAASRLLPPSIRQRAFALYAFCRASDDLIDDGGAGRPGLAALRARLDAAYAGRPDETLSDRAFAAVVRDCHVPKALPAALIEGLEWDVEGRRFETLGDVHAYSARVAGTVGAMMTLVMGVRRPLALARATDLGAAMQLTNIARDVGEDARAGRLYLPLTWMREAGLDPDDFLANPRPSAELAGLMKRLLHEADRLYHRGLSGVALLPVLCRPAILAAGLVYAEIGRTIEQNGHDSVTRRAYVPGSRKRVLLARALRQSAWPGRVSHDRPLAANQYLVEAASAGHAEADAALNDLHPPARLMELCLRARRRTLGLEARAQ